ncbi:MAG: hypothetical protein IT355_13710 [Gemmatimonadaceae bacterium]|nr:hypothetical protein [Gemmatimonadaceae bacterium]
MTSPIVVFLGPSLPLRDAMAELDAVFLPPARQADIITAVRVHRPRAIALIDGEFGQSLSVWHKELLYAIDRGIPVYGASSMGALRAAEVAPFGMIGVGRIYDMFADGTLTDDDEVALSHGRDETGYRAFSVPMVNIRATLAAACAAGRIDGADRDRLIALAKSAFFPERTWARLWRDATAAGVAPDVIDAARQFVATGALDLKRDDALALLRQLRALPADPSADTTAAARPEFEFNRSHLFEALYQRDRQVAHGETLVPLAAVGDYAALHHPDYNALNEQAMNRALVGVLAEELEITATDADVAEAESRFRLARRLTSQAALDAWCEANDVDRREFTALMRELATTRVLHRWLTTRKFMERTTRIVLDELRLRGDYARMKAMAAQQEQILADHHQLFTETSYNELRTRDLVIEHLRATPCRMDAPYKTWADDAGFHSSGDLRIELLRARLARQFVKDLATESMHGTAAQPA